jgi:hypothetical protein
MLHLDSVIDCSVLRACQCFVYRFDGTHSGNEMSILGNQAASIGLRNHLTLGEHKFVNLESPSWVLHRHLLKDIPIRQTSSLHRISQSSASQ